MQFRRNFDPVKLNKSYICLLPMLELEGLHLNKHYLLNVYLRSEDKKEYAIEHLFLHYELTNDISFIRSESFLKKTKNYVDSYEPDNYTVIHIFKIPEKWIKDYYIFLDSKYSRISENLKRQIFKFHQCKKSDDIVLTLYRREEKRKRLEEELLVRISPESELADPLDFSKEIYTNEHKIKNPDNLNYLWRKFNFNTESYIP